LAPTTTYTQDSFGVADITFVAFLLLVFVGLQPFAIRDDQSLLAGAMGAGDSSRQIAYTGVFFASLVIALFKRRVVSLTVVPASLTVVLSWCLLSAAWALEPAIALRRLGLTTLVVLTIALSIQSLGVQRVLKLLRFVLATILIVDLVSIAIVPQAVHLSGEKAADLVGAWRGLHFHKNIAGVVAALSAILFASFAAATRRRRDWLLFAGAMVFLFMTRAKTSIALVGMAVAAGYVYRRALHSPRARFRVLLGMMAGLCVIFAAAALNQDALFSLLDDPELLTGRGAIWQALAASAKDHPFVGVGYGSFWNIGDRTPVTQYSNSWVTLAAHGHNGYLDVLVQVGVIGLALVMIGLFVLPFNRLLSAGAHATSLRALCFSVFVFVTFFNLTESGLLERDRPEWVMFVIMLTVLHRLEADRVKPLLSQLAAIRPTIDHKVGEDLPPLS
jgi:O-antigen ligase